MNRETALEMMQEALDRGENESLPEVLRATLDADPQLRAAWEELCAVESALNGLDDQAPPPPADLHDRIMAGVQDTQTPAPAGRARRWSAWAGMTAAAAAILAAVAVSSFNKPVPVTPSPTPTPNVEMALDVHLPKLSLSDEFRAPRQYVAEKKSEMIRSAETFLVRAGNVLPRLPENASSAAEG